MTDMINQAANDRAAVAATGDPAMLMLAFGMKYATGEDGEPDLVAAHKWFNLAAMRGNQDAIRLRREIAAEMTTQEITTAQRAAREWITTH